MPNTKVATYIELKPKHYVGGISLTIRCKPSERWIAELLLSDLSAIEGWAIQREAPTPRRTETMETTGTAGIRCGRQGGEVGAASSGN